jgi:hypothetical protein
MVFVEAGALFHPAKRSSAVFDAPDREEPDELLTSNRTRASGPA